MRLKFFGIRKKFTAALLPSHYFVAFIQKRTSPIKLLFSRLPIDMAMAMSYISRLLCPRSLL